MKCGYCDFGFENLNDLADHVIFKHVWFHQNGPSTACPCCKTHTQQMLDHMKNKHPSICFFCVEEMCSPHLKCASLMNQAFGTQMLCHMMNQIEMFETGQCPVCTSKENKFQKIWKRKVEKGKTP